MRTIEMGILCLPDGRLEVHQYGADGATCRQTTHTPAELLALNGTVAATVQQAIASPGTVCRLEVVRAPKKRKPRARRKPAKQQHSFSWQDAGWS